MLLKLCAACLVFVLPVAGFVSGLPNEFSNRPVVRRIQRNSAAHTRTHTHTHTLDDHGATECGIKSFEAALEDLEKKCRQHSLPMPLSWESVWNSSHHGGAANRYRLGRAAQKLLHEKSLRILVVGGSMTHGEGCDIEAEYWPALLGRLLEINFGATVEVVNKGAGGSTSGFAAMHVWDHFKKMGSFDIVISEYHFNDAVAAGPLPPAVIHKSNAELLYAVMGQPNKPAFVFLDVPNWGVKLNPSLASANSSVHWEVANQFEAPIVWYPEAVRASGSLYMDQEDIEHEHNRVNTRRRGVVLERKPIDLPLSMRVAEQLAPHPACFPGHHVIASLLYGTIHQEAVDVCKHGVQGSDTVLREMDDVDESIKAMVRCYAHPRLYASAQDGEAAFPVGQGSEWRFFEDRPYKPGWIAASGQPKEIVFREIPVGMGTIEVTYLRSYEGLGDLNCDLAMGGKSVRKAKLQGSWQDKSSQESTMQFANLTSGIYNLQCVSDGRKFKIVGLLSC